MHSGVAGMVCMISKEADILVQPLFLRNDNVSLGFDFHFEQGCPPIIVRESQMMQVTIADDLFQQCFRAMRMDGGLNETLHQADILGMHTKRIQKCCSDL